MIYDGVRIVKIVSTKKARLWSDWYKDLVGQEFEVLMYDMIAAEYTVKHGDKFYRLPDEDVEVVSDTSQPKGI